MIWHTLHAKAKMAEEQSSSEFCLTYTLNPLLVKKDKVLVMKEQMNLVSHQAEAEKDPGRLKIGKKHKGRKAGLRENAPAISIENIKSKKCCQKSCIAQFSSEHLLSLRQHFNTLIYDEQNLFLSGLLERKETKKTVGHRRKSNPTIGKNGKKVGRPPAEDSICSIVYRIRDKKGIHKKVCQKAFFWFSALEKEGLKYFVKRFV